jgi:hypothetical protein
MTHKLLHIGIRPVDPVDWARLEKTFDSLGDWLRLNEANWYLWTSERAVIVNRALQPVIGDRGSIVILQIDTSPDSERWGFAPQPVWDWLNDKRDKALLGA